MSLWTTFFNRKMTRSGLYIYTVYVELATLESLHRQQYPQHFNTSYITYIIRGLFHGVSSLNT